MEGFWAITHAGRSISPKPLAINSRVLEEQDIDEVDEEVRSTTSIVTPILSPRACLTQISSTAKKRRVYPDLPLEQPDCALSRLPDEVLQYILHHLTEWDLLVATGVCRGWRMLLLEETTDNALFWRDEVKRYQKEVKAWEVHRHLFSHFFASDRPPLVSDSHALFRIRLERLHEVAQRRRFYQKLTKGYTPLRGAEDSGSEESTVARNSAAVLCARLFLLDFFHEFSGLEVVWFLFVFFQAIAVTVKLTLGISCSWFLWLAPSLLLSVLWLVHSTADFVLLIASACSDKARDVDSYMWQSRWVTVSTSPRVNRTVLFLCSLCWIAFVLLVEIKIDIIKEIPTFSIAFSPLYALLGICIIAAVGDIYRQSPIYFWLDEGYDFVESPYRKEAEEQLRQTWDHLVSRRLYWFVMKLIFLFLLMIKLDNWSCTDRLPWSVVFIPLEMSIILLYFICVHRHGYRSLKPTLMWSTVCALLFFAVLGLDMDVSISMGYKLNPNDLLFPFWVCCLPLWGIVLGPVVQMVLH